MAKQVQRQDDDRASYNPASISAEKFDSLEGVEFGGKSEILNIAVGEVSGPVTYVGSQKMTTDLGEVNAHTGSINGESIRLPISATFLRAVEQAQLSRGDVFFLKREEDGQKKKGVGKGQTMQMYKIKVTERAPAARALVAA